MKERSGAEWYSRERLQSLVLGLATLLCLYLCYLIVKPFIPPVAFAVALAVATHRPYAWFKARLKRDTAAAAFAVLLTALLIVGPAVLIGNYIVREGINNLNQLRAGGFDWRGSIAAQPRLGYWMTWVQERFDIETQIQRVTDALAGQATNFLKGSIAVVTQLAITLFVLFFLYKDETFALQKLYEAVPLSRNEAQLMFSRLAATIRATVNGSVTVAGIQAVLAAMMYVILGVPAPALWGATTFIAALIPVFGTVLVWGPIVFYLVAIGSWTKALILLTWGILAVGSIDNVLYPFLVGDKLRVHTVPTFFALVGGISLFGPAGLILGPLILAITLALIDIWWWRTQPPPPLSTTNLSVVDTESSEGAART